MVHEEADASDWAFHEISARCSGWIIQETHSLCPQHWMGQKHDYTSITTYEDFVNRVPVNEYNDLKPYIDRLRQGEQNLLWSSEVKWFAKSSGTTSDKSKFIPVSQEALDECHFKGGKDLLSIYCNNHPDTQIFSGRLLGMGGSHFPDNPEAGTLSEMFRPL